MLKSPSKRIKGLNEIIKKVDLSDVVPRDPETGRVPYKYWNRRSNRVKVIRAFVERCGLPIHELRTSHFIDNGLLPVLAHYPRQHMRISALKEAGYELTDEVVYKRSAPYATPEKRRELAEGLAKRLGKKISELTHIELKAASLGALLKRAGGLRGLMRDCGYDPDRIKRPRGYWAVRANRRRAIEGVLKATGKRPEELTEQDLLAHGAGILLSLNRLIPRSKRLDMLLSDIGLSGEAIELDEWGLRPKCMLGRWEDISKEERVRILRGIAEKLGKEVGDLDAIDIVHLGLMGLINNGSDAPRSLLRLLGWAGVDPKRVRRKREK